MPDTQKVGVTLSAEGAEEFKRALADSNNAMASFGEAAGGASGQINALGEIAVGALREIGSAAIDFLGEAIGKLIEFGQESFGAALAAEQQQAQLANSVKNAGAAFGGSVADVNNLAMKYRDLAGGSDEAIVAIEQIGIKAGTVSKEQMPDFIKRVTDLAAVTGDATSAATLLARAQDDPMGAFTRLERQTGVYDVALKAQIASMVKAGDTAGATAKVMAFVAESTGGAAAANADTMAGRWDILKNHLEDAGKSVLEKLLPSLEKLFDQYIEPNIPVIENLADAFSAKLGPALDLLSGLFGDVTSQGGDLGVLFDDLNELVPGLQGNFGGLQEGILNFQRGFLPVFQSVVTWIQTNVPAALNFLEGIWLKIWPTMQATFASVFSYVQSVFAAALPSISANLQVALAGMATWWKNHGDEVITIVKADVVLIGAEFKIVADIIGAVLVTISGLFAAFWDLVNGDTAGAEKVLTDSVAQALNMIMSLVGSNLTDTVAVWQADWNLFVMIIQAVWQKIDSVISGFISKIEGYVAAFLGSIAAALQSVKNTAGEIGNIVSSVIGGGTPSHAAGGYAPAGQPAIFGEEGPELAIPMTNSWVLPAATTQQMMNSSSTTTYGPQFNYSPKYYGAPPQPSVDFAIMQVMAG